MILETLFLISNLYWLIAFSYIVFRAVKHTYTFIKGYKNGQIKHTYTFIKGYKIYGQITNVKFNLQRKWLAYICFPFFKRYIYKEKKTK